MLTTRNRIVTWPIVSSDFWRDMNGIHGEAPPEPEPTWTPRAMISESEDRYTVRLEVPGADMDTLNVELDGDVLLVSGQRSSLAGLADEKVLVCETELGPFRRRFRLRAEADRDGISADYADGILTISVPKRQEARPRRIAVSTAAD